MKSKLYEGSRNPKFPADIVIYNETACAKYFTWLTVDMRPRLTSPFLGLCITGHWVDNFVMAWIGFFSFVNSWKWKKIVLEFVKTISFVIREAKKYRSWIRENWKISFVNSWIEPPWGGLLEDWRQFFVHIGAAWLSYRNRKAPEFRHHWKQKSRRCFPSHACSWAITGASAKLCTSKSHPSYNHKTDFIAFHPPTI